MTAFYEIVNLNKYISQLLYYPVTLLPNYSITLLLNYLITQLPNYPIAQLPNYLSPLSIHQIKPSIIKRLYKARLSTIRYFIGFSQLERILV
jgi:hypothetical protein